MDNTKKETQWVLDEYVRCVNDSDEITERLQSIIDSIPNKESKPVEETNEAKMWDEIEQTYFDFYNISDNEDSFNLTAKDITKLLKSKFTITRK